MLAITGAEAMYADLGHFNARAVTVSVVVLSVFFRLLLRATPFDCSWVFAADMIMQQCRLWMTCLLQHASHCLYCWLIVFALVAFALGCHTLPGQHPASATCDNTPAR